VAEEPEKVEVKQVRRQPPQKSQQSTLYKRLYNAIFPVIGGLILDLTDLATFGPIGLYFGFLLGAAIGWLVGSIYGFSTRTRLFWTILAGIYCMVPGTAFFPLATIISAAARFDKTT